MAKKISHFPFFSAAFLATMEPYEQIFLDFLMNSIGLKSQHLKHEAANMAKKIELLEISKRFKSYLIFFLSHTHTSFF